MPEFVTFEKREASPARLLRPKDFVEVKFRPVEGRVQAFAFAGPEEIGLGRIDPFPERGDDAESSRPVLIRAQLRSPKGTVATKVLRSRLLGDGTPEFLTFDVSQPLARQEWSCKFTNADTVRALCSGAVTFAGSRHVVKTTRIPLRLLNNALRQLLDTLRLRIRLDGRDSFIAVSPEAIELSDGALGTKRFEVDNRINDVNLETLSISFLRSRSGRPAIFIVMVAEEEGRELVLFNTQIGPLAFDVENLAIAITIELLTVGLPGKRTIRVEATVESGAKLEGIFDAAGVDLAGVIESKVEELINSFEFREAVGPYLSRGLAQLAARGPDLVAHEFHEVGIERDAANPLGRNLVVKHFDPVDRPPVTPGTEVPGDEPLPLPRPFPDDPEEPPVDPVALRNLTKIEHIVVLMQENRSFDHMLGYLRAEAGRTDVDGLRGNETNSAPGLAGGVNVTPLEEVRCVLRSGPIGTGQAAYDFSPFHDHEHVLLQVAEGKMSGFLSSFRERYPNAPPECGMAFFSGRQLDTFDVLAKNFLVCDRWFCSHPGPTQPNRFCALTGFTPELDNYDVDKPHIGYLRQRTIFDHLTNASVDWAYFEQDVAFLRFYDNYRLDDRRVRSFWDPDDGFLVRARDGRLPSVTFIDPNFVDVPPIRTANDDHAPAEVKRGQDNIACIYDALTRSPQWRKILFVITYDEHGGFYDHVPPPGTLESDERRPAAVHLEGLRFYGPRVPTFVVSPWVPAGRVSHTIFDHTSILKTIILRFLPDRQPDLGLRVRTAQHLGGLLTNRRPRLKVPKLDRDCVPKRPSPEDLPPLEPPDPKDFHVAMRNFGKPVPLR